MKKVLLGLILFSLSCFKSYGQSELTFKGYDRSDGLSDNGITSLVKDKTGYLWIGTNNGLNRFDGHTFKSYYHSYSDSNSLAENYVYRLAVDSKNRIWAGHLHNISCYDPKLKSFRNYLGELGERKVESLYVDEQGFVWVGFARKGLYRFDPVNGQIKKISLLPFIYKGYDSLIKLTRNTVNDIFRDNEGILWLATQDGLYTYNTNSDRLLPMRDGGTDAITKILPGEGGIWLASSTGKLLFFNTKTKERYNYDLGTNTNAIASIAWKEYGGSILVAVDRRSIGVFDTKLKRFIPDYYRLDPTQILSDFVNNCIWVGTRLGLFRSNKLIKPYEHHYFSALKGSKLVSGLSIDSALNKKFFAVGDEIFITNLHDQKFRPSENLHGNGERRTNIISLLNFSTDSLLVISSGSVNFFDKKKERWLDFRMPNDTKINAGFIKTMRDENGNYWIASLNDGAFRLNRKSLEVTHFKHDKGALASLVSNRITGIIEDKRGDIWFSSLDSGLSIYDVRNKSFKNIRRGQNGLSSNSLEDIAMSSDGLIWMPSFQGLIKGERLDGDKIQFNGLRNAALGAATVQVAVDKEDRVWTYGATGVVVYYPGRGAVKEFGDEIFETDDSGSDFRLFDYNGDTYIGKTNGYFKIKSEELQQDTVSLPVILNSVVNLDEDVNFNLYSRQNPFPVSFRKNSIQIEFSTIDFSNSPLVQYAYKLEGWDKGWNFTNRDQRSVNYANLRAGSYVFKMKVVNADGVESKVREMLFLEVDAPYWRRSWFFFSAIAFTVVYCFGIYILRVVTDIKKKRLKLQMDEQMSKSELVALRSQMNPHFIFNSLNAINKYILKADIQKAAQFLTSFSKLMRRILEDSSEPLVPLDKEIEMLDLYLNIESLRFEKQFRYEITTEGIFVESIKIPSMVIQPYVENAIWHGILHKGNEGEILVKFFNKQGVLACLVQDNGVGYKTSLKEKSENNTLSKSFGLQITAKRLLLLNGQTDVSIIDRSELNDGSTGTKVEIVFSKIKIIEDN